MSKRVSMILAAGASAAVLLTGCSSSSDSKAAAAPASSTSAASTTTSAAPAPSGSSSGAVSADAQKYLSLTAPVNADLQGFLQLPNATPIKQIQAAAGKLATDEKSLVAQLKQAQWSSGVQATLTTLESTATAEQAVYQQCATAPNVTALKAILTKGRAAIASRASAAAQVKAALGLPAATSAPGATPSASTSA